MNNKNLSKKLNYEYIRGLIEGEGCFTFYTTKNLNGTKRKTPAFVIGMNDRDNKLLGMVRDALGLRNPIYARYSSSKYKGKRSGVAVLVVREFDQLKDIIIPLFYKKLSGYKGVQFMEWFEKIGSDPDVSNRFKSLHHLYKLGVYDTHPGFVEKFKD
jgi:hypothetical protein